MFCLDRAHNTYPFAANMFNQMGYEYVPGDDMSDEDESQIMADLRAIADYGAPNTAPHGFVYHSDLLEFWENNKQDLLAYLRYWSHGMSEEEIAEELGLPYFHTFDALCDDLSDEAKEKIIWRFLEMVAIDVVYFV